jgi:hypothetical protein
VNEANASRNSEILTQAVDAAWPELGERDMNTLSQKVSLWPLCLTGCGVS